MTTVLSGSVTPTTVVEGLTIKTKMRTGSVGSQIRGLSPY